MTCLIKCKNRFIFFQKDETAEKWIDEFSSETSWQTDWSPDAAHISSLDDQIPRSQSWLRHLMDHGDRYSEYQCAKINRYIDHPKPYEEGLQRLREHDIVNAILLFESAVQKQSNHADVKRKCFLFLHFLSLVRYLGMALSGNNPK